MVFCYGDVVRVLRPAPEKGILLRYLLEDSDRIYLAPDLPIAIPDTKVQLPKGSGIRAYTKPEMSIEFVGRPEHNGNIVFTDRPYILSGKALASMVEHRLELVRNGISAPQKLNEARMLVEFLGYNEHDFPGPTAQYFAGLSEAFYSAGLGDFTTFRRRART